MAGGGGGCAGSGTTSEDEKASMSMLAFLLFPRNYSGRLAHLCDECKLVASGDKLAFITQMSEPPAASSQDERERVSLLPTPE